MRDRRIFRRPGGCGHYDGEDDRLLKPVPAASTSRGLLRDRTEPLEIHRRGLRFRRTALGLYLFQTIRGVPKKVASTFGRPLLLVPVNRVPAQYARVFEGVQMYKET